MTAEGVIEKLRVYMQTADEFDALQKRIGTEWPVPKELHGCIPPAQRKLSAAWNDMEAALRNYDLKQVSN